jgi:hypothetical protein
MSRLFNAPARHLATALFSILTGVALLPIPASAQTLSTTDSSLNTGKPTSTTYTAPGTNGLNGPVPLSTNTSKTLWLMYDNPWGISTGSGTIKQVYSGTGSITTTVNLTGLPGGGVDGSPFVLYGCDQWMDCYQDQPPHFPKQLSAMSSLVVDLKYALKGTITGRDTDLIFDEWVCTTSSPTDSSQCLEVEILPYYSFVEFGGGTYVKTINEPATINGVVTTFSFDEYKGGGNMLFYPHKMPGLASGELKFNLLDLLKEGVSTYGNNSYQYLVGIELGTEFGASSIQSYALTLNKLAIDQTLGNQPAPPTNLTAKPQ